MLHNIEVADSLENEKGLSEAKEHSSKMGQKISQAGSLGVFRDPLGLPLSRYLEEELVSASSAWDDSPDPSPLSSSLCFAPVPLKILQFGKNQTKDGNSTKQQS